MIFLYVLVLPLRLLWGAPRGSLLAKIIGSWSESKRFTDKYGKPKVLSVEGAASEFVDLVKSVSTDLNPYTIRWSMSGILSSGFWVKVQSFKRGFKIIWLNLTLILKNPVKLGLLRYVVYL